MKYFNLILFALILALDGCERFDNEYGNFESYELCINMCNQYNNQIDRYEARDNKCFCKRR